MIYQLVSKDASILRQRCNEFDFKNDNAYELATNLIETMNANNGIGLAANQCNIPKRVFVMKGEPNYACFNPKIINQSDEVILLEEACLSFPGVVVPIKRPKSIRVRFQTPNGEVTTKTFTGMTARTFLHELDHLNGILFYNNANRYHREKALKRAK